MKNLLIEEMKRAINIMETKGDIKKSVMVEDVKYPYQMTDKEVVELFELFKMIRRHTKIIERESTNVTE